jgi:hypothetical protein
MIEAGNETQFEWGDGNWVFLDIGFSGAAMREAGRAD